MTIVKISGKEALKVKGGTNWNDVDKLTDAEILEAAKTDPDSAMPTDEELKTFKRISKKPGEK